MKLVSEQLPNDGGYHIKRLVDEANGRLKQIGKHGKRATIVAKKSSLSLQFTFKDGNGNSQKNPGLGAIPMSAGGVAEAEKIAQLVTGQLVAGTFTWDWYNNLIGKDTSEQNKQLTCREMVEQYKKHYFKQRQGNKNPNKTWYASYRYLESILSNSDKPLTLPLIRQIVENTGNNTDTRKYTLNGLVSFLKYFDNTDYKNAIKDYKANNKPEAKSRNVPSDKRITEVYENGFVPKPRCNKKYLYRYPQWQFLFGLLATYGLRIHEAWNIANWDKPVTLKNGDWVTVDVDDDSTIEVQRSGEDLIIPAVIGAKDSEHILCIGHNTKTGFRMAMPLSPEGHNWLEEFNLLQPLNLPDIPNPLKRRSNGTASLSSTTKTCSWFLEHKYGFTPHDLRHAYNHRGHLMGYNPKTLADSLGHTITMNSNSYLRHMSLSVQLQGMQDAIQKEQNKRSENELLKEKVKDLEAQLKAAKDKIELLETKLQLNDTYQQSKNLS